MNDLSRRFFLRGAAAIGFMPAVAAQKQEWDSFRKHVSQWERDRYLELY